MNEMQLLQSRNPVNEADLVLDDDLLDAIVATERPHSLGRRLGGAVAVAATLTAVVGVPAMLHEQHRTPPQAEPTTPRSPAPTVHPQLRFTAAAMRIARHNPRVLVTAPGWKVRTLGAFSTTDGEMGFQLDPDRWHDTKTVDGTGQLVTSVHENLAPSLEVDWYPASQYHGYYADRAQETHRTIQVFGAPALLVTYTSTDHAVMLPPDGGVFLELRGQHLGDEAAFLRFLHEHVAKAGVEQWLAALPPEMVTAGNAAGRLEKVLADIPLPPGFNSTRLGKDEALDPYQYGATVTGQVACGWIQAWQRARSKHDPMGQAQAVRALQSSHHWKVLQQMDPEGDYPEVVWEYADDIAAGKAPQGYRDGLGC